MGKSMSRGVVKLCYRGQKYRLTKGVLVNLIFVEEDSPPPPLTDVETKHVLGVIQIH